MPKGTDTSHRLIQHEHASSGIYNASTCTAKVQREYALVTGTKYEQPVLL